MNFEKRSTQQLLETQSKCFEYEAKKHLERHGIVSDHMFTINNTLPKYLSQANMSAYQQRAMNALQMQQLYGGFPMPSEPYPLFNSKKQRLLLLTTKQKKGKV